MERLGAAVNWAPTFGMLGGPELGPMGGGSSEYAVYTVGAIVFSSKAAKPQTLMLTDATDEGGGGKAKGGKGSSLFSS